MRAPHRGGQWETGDVNEHAVTTVVVGGDPLNSAAHGHSSLEVAALPWVFTQHYPLDTDGFIDLAKQRGFNLYPSTLRVLYRNNLLVPFLVVRPKPVGLPATVPVAEPPALSGRLRQFRQARDTDRLLDLASVPYQSCLQFDRPAQASFDWWNGLVYSWHQVIVLPALRSLLERCHYTIRAGRRVAYLPKPSPGFVESLARYRRIVLAATALEARYLPTLDPEWVHLVATSAEEWQRYREEFDPVVINELLDYPAQQARDDAEFLLSRAHSMDPVGTSWGRLVRRAPRDSWKDLKDAARSAMDFRESAEVLLCYCDDLAKRGAGDPLPVIDRDLNPRMAWHPLVERLSYRLDTLDQDLMNLGISPHPRVVLAVEGETEEIHVPKVWAALEYPDAPELMRVLKLGGVDHDPVKVGALAAAPLIARQDESRDFWWVIKPPTCFMIATDPEGRFYGSAQKIKATRKKLLAEIEAVVKAQQATVSSAELNALVEIRTWRESCYEFADFNNDELADGIMAVHTTINGLTRDELVTAIVETRGRRKDIKEVWSQWSYSVSKRELAYALWPTLAKKIEAARADVAAPVPEIVEVVRRAYRVAQNWRYKTFVLPTPAEPSPVSASDQN